MKESNQEPDSLHSYQNTITISLMWDSIVETSLMFSKKFWWNNSETLGVDGWNHFERRHFKRGKIVSQENPPFKKISPEFNTIKIRASIKLFDENLSIFPDLAVNGK